MEAYTAEPRREREVSPSRRVSVMTTARLHFGFLDPSGRGAQPFGSFGLSLEWPRTQLTLRRADALVVTGPEHERAERYFRSITASFRVPKAFALEIEEAIPPHAGLGSGTQLALAVGAALGAFGGLRLDPQEIAARLGRGARSGIGMATFASGGVVLDSGPRDSALPQLVARLPFPADWRVLLIFDPELQGLAGLNETEAFEQLPDFPEGESEALRQSVIEDALPALAAVDFDRFCASVGRLQAAMGSYFAPLEGGAYTSPLVGEVLSWLQGQGLTGLGQSSWGPTGFAFVPSEAEGQNLLGQVRSLPAAARLRLALGRGRNEGAEIAVEGGENP